MALKMPLTAKQLAKKIGLPADMCSYIVGKLAGQELIVCLNPTAQNSRLYWLSGFGKQCQKQLCLDSNLPYEEYDLCSVNWELYGWLCFSHRSIVVKTLTSPMQPSQIKRALRIHMLNVKISANNIRDVVKLLLHRGIVRPVKIKKKTHWRYELTEIGEIYRQLLMRADSML